MTSTERSARTSQLRRWLTWTGIAVVVLAAVVAALLAAGETETAAGAATGGGLVVLGSLGAGWWVRRRSDRAGSASRVMGGVPDERDNAVHRSAAAATGVAALGLSAGASLAVALGAAADVVVGSLPFALILTFVTAFAVLNRRM